MKVEAKLYPLIVKFSDLQCEIYDVFVLQRQTEAVIQSWWT